MTTPELIAACRAVLKAKLAATQGSEGRMLYGGYEKLLDELEQHYKAWRKYAGWDVKLITMIANALGVKHDN